MCRRRLTVLVPLLAVLAATVLAAAPASAGGGGCHRPATEGHGTTLTLTELCFSPNVLRVAPGSEVTIVNRDTLTHPLGRPGGEWAWEGNVGDRVTVRLDGDGV
jgi:plastocyanin